MGDLRNKARKEAATQAIRDAEDRRENGFTIFHFDYNPALTRRNMDLGQAVRHLMKVTSTKISLWRCPARGLGLTYKALPTTTYSYDSGETYRILHFSDLEDEAAAKKVLALDVLLSGIGLYRGLPNKIFDEQIELIARILQAPPSVPAEEWLAARGKVHRQSRPLLRTHEAELRQNLLGEKFARSTAPVGLTVRARLETLGDRARETYG